MFERTYELQTPPAPAMSTADYAEQGQKELQQLLDSGECNEKAYQALLERYPIFIPGTDPQLPVGQNGIFPQGVITQPLLSGMQSKRPDFLVMSYDSGSVYTTFIEIESPCKEWSTGSGQSTADLTQAIQQLRDWRIWFADPLNHAKFIQEYHLPQEITKGRDLQQHYVLIYGRREELQAKGFSKKRNQLAHPNETFMTWDRVGPQAYRVPLFTLTIGAPGYTVHTVPPTLTVGPHSARHHQILLGRHEALARAFDIPEARREFIKARWPYWDDWADKRKGRLQGYTLKTAFDEE